MLVREILALIPHNFDLFDEVDLVADQADEARLVCTLPDALDPGFCCLQWWPVCYVIDNKGGHRPTIVIPRDMTQLFITCCVPQLQSDFSFVVWWWLIVDFDPDLGKSCLNGWLLIWVQLTRLNILEDGGLADTDISAQHNFSVLHFIKFIF